MNNLLLVILNEQSQGSVGLQTFGMMVVLFAIIYFFMIRPQSKKQKEIQKFRNALQKGQDVITIGGLHGTISHIDEEKNTVTLEVSTGVKLVFEKSAIMPAGSPVGQEGK